MKIRKCKLGLIIWIVFLVTIDGQDDSLYYALPLNQIQIIGSHNSYKIAIEKELWNIIYQRDSILAYSLHYEHLSISEQLNLGLRNLEIDLFHDPVGCRYSKPYGIEILNSLNNKTEPFDEKNELCKPGLKIFHIQDFDFRSHNLLFKNFLEELNKWSAENINHLPIIITINAKDEKLDEANTTIPLPFTKAALDSIDFEIQSVLPDSKLITPDLIKGNYLTLEEAILKNGWPRIELVAGRFLFVFDETGEKLNNYLNPDGSLTGKIMFVNLKEGNPSAAIRIINEPVENKDYIKALVRKGYLVRTRADADTKEARENDYSRFNSAVESGAQIITTDYYLTSKLFASNYNVVFPDNKYVQQNNFIINIGN